MAVVVQKGIRLELLDSPQGDQAVPRLGMRSRRMKARWYAVCIRNKGYAASLEVRKLYPALEDPDAEENDLIRVIDESGEDYLYPSRLFQRLTLPSEVQRALQLVSEDLGTSCAQAGLPYRRNSPALA